MRGLRRRELIRRCHRGFKIQRRVRTPCLGGQHSEVEPQLVATAAGRTLSHASYASVSGGSSQYVPLSRCMAATSASSRLYLDDPAADAPPRPTAARCVRLGRAPGLSLNSVWIASLTCSRRSAQSPLAADFAGHVC